MDLSPRKPSKRALEPVDEWLQNEGFYRKNAPKDPTCLFRAVSEQIYQTQRNHIILRQECVDFMRQNRQIFEEKISIPFDTYLDQMTCFTEWGSTNELLAMSMMFKKNVVIFHGHKLTKETEIDNGHEESLYLCFTPPKQYESVYTQEYTANAGFCQAIVYQTLYKDVFQMNNVDEIVHKMLHERNNNLRHDKFFLRGNVDIRNQLTLELFNKLDETEETEEMQLISKGITPFPYRVAKALDPNIYRNVDFDVWHEIRKEVRNSGYTKFNSTELQAGAKCLVQIGLKENDKANNNYMTPNDNWECNKNGVERSGPTFYTGHIQTMSKNEGPAVVFVEKLGEKMTVPYEALKPFPQRKVKQNNWPVIPNKKNMNVPQNTKWKKPFNPTGRKVKELTPNDNNNDRKQQNSPKSVSPNLTKSDWSAETISDNHQAETYPTYKEYTVETSMENVRTVLENTHISTVETVEQQVSINKTTNTSTNFNSLDVSAKKEVPTNLNLDPNQSNKSVEKNEVFYQPYQNGMYSPTFRYPGDSGLVNYEIIKNPEMETNELLQYADPASVNHFSNLGVKYMWSHNVWSNGNNGQPFADNSYYITQPPHPDLNIGVNMMNGSIPMTENMHQVPNPPNNSNNRQNNRSTTPKHRDQDNPRSNGQKPNYRNSGQMTSQSSNNNRNGNFNEQNQQSSNHKDSQRGNKSNNLAPRFKRNYEGRNRYDHQNGQYQYRQQQQQQHRQDNNDYRYNGRKQQQHHEIQMMPNPHQQHQFQQQQQQQQQHQIDINDVSQIHPQQQNIMHQQQQQPMPILQPQTSPSPQAVNATYPYPIYNQQMPFVPMTYPIESELYPGQFYPAPPGFIPIPYLPSPGEFNEAGPPPPGPIYAAPIENFPPPPYQPVQYVTYHPPPGAFYSNQQPTPPAAIIPNGENCYPPYPGQSYIITYPPPPPPPQMTSQNIAPVPSPPNGPPSH